MDLEDVEEQLIQSFDKIENGLHEVEAALDAFAVILVVEHGLNHPPHDNIQLSNEP